MIKMKKFPKINNLVELFFNQYENQFDKSKILLSSLKEPRKDYSWQETFNSIKLLKLSKFITFFGGRRENRTLTSCKTRF